MPPLVARRRTDLLAAAMDRMEGTTGEAYRCCDLLTKRARQLDSLTSPASDASSMLSRANANLAGTVVLMKDARDKFDTVLDCEPAVARMHKGVQDMEQMRLAGRSKGLAKNRTVLTEQDIYAAGDSLEILRDAFDYFSQRSDWKSTPATLGDLERVYKQGTDAMCLLVSSHLKKAGQAVRPKRNKKDAVVPPTEETAQEVSLSTNGGGAVDPLCLFHCSWLTSCFIFVLHRPANALLPLCKTATCSSRSVNLKNTSPLKLVRFARFDLCLNVSEATATSSVPCRSESLPVWRKSLASPPTRCCARKKWARAATPTWCASPSRRAFRSWTPTARRARKLPSSPTTTITAA